MQDHNSLPIQSPSSTLPLSAITLTVAEFLLNTYTNRVNPQYPIYLPADVQEPFNAVYYRTVADRSLLTEPSSCHTYIVSLVMAISLSTAARHKQAHAQSLATGLFKTAVQHVPKMWSNDLSGLQALLLATQYVFLNPDVANLTLLTGLASEACIDMGLHQEPPSDCVLNAQERELRRRVFWCAWEMEVAVAACVRRAPKIPNDIITTALPYGPGDLAISPALSDMTDQSPNFMISGRIWAYRRLESEIMNVLYRSPTLSEDPLLLEAWISEMEDKIRTWREEVNVAAADNKDDSKKSQWDELILYAQIGYHYVLVCLFGPCPRIPTRSRPDLLKAFAAAVCVASGYYDQANSAAGHTKYVFHSCYHTFSSAIVFLYTLETCKNAIFESYTFTEIENFLEYFPMLFSTMAERWPAVSRCSQEFQQRLQPIKDEYTTFIFERASEPDYEAPGRNSWRTVEGDGEREKLDDNFYDIPYDWNVEFGFGIDNIFSN
ncbi:hypothetical protein AYO21_02843 [Fonsecaea monophora]|uniref:Xylanolytic transcriptional activator regulatory domain-containing protein n=1 Tax=Fonsecaea monophora TaxID=254056 RepID=A0A177FHL4_9EURO|nr:hypothetical protein AYO21_02843 [Fonsecaea monophora]OAG42892.1 hypothetical protein AYO21_02843 [Fonsecaea monophora]